MSHCSDSFSQQINSSGKPFVTLASQCVTNYPDRPQKLNAWYW